MDRQRQAHDRHGAGESADGFGAHIPANHPGNVFRGCRAWWNSDDGFDLISAYSSVTIENSWAWCNGYVPGTTTGAGNGNGFKAGGYSGGYDANAVKHNDAFNSWNLGVTLSDAQFRSVSTSRWDASRQADGSLPVMPNLRLAANSTLIDKGTGVGLPYNGAAPDLGAFES